MKPYPLILLMLILSAALSACSGTRPTDLGVQNGKLLPCPSSPNCVSSFEDPDDKEHYIAPFSYGEGVAIKAQLENALNSLTNATVIQSKDDYLYVEFQSSLMRYVDDVEFYIVPQQQKVHVRSASRLGHSDMGVNRKRIDEIWGMLNKD